MGPCLSEWDFNKAVPSIKFFLESPCGYFAVIGLERFWVVQSRGPSMVASWELREMKLPI